MSPDRFHRRFDVPVDDLICTNKAGRFGNRWVIWRTDELGDRVQVTEGDVYKMSEWLRRLRALQGKELSE